MRQRGSKFSQSPDLLTAKVQACQMHLKYGGQIV